MFDELWKNVETDVKKWAAGKSTLKHSIELLDDIIAENNISNVNLHLMFDKIIIEETDEGLNLDLRLKSPFISKAKESLLKKYMIIDNEILQQGT